MYWATVEVATIVVATKGTEAPKAGAIKREARNAKTTLIHNAFSDNFILF